MSKPNLTPEEKRNRFGYKGSGKRRKPATDVGPADRRYFALHESGLRNGSFYRVTIQYGDFTGIGVVNVAQFINGDCMGRVEEVPARYYDKPLVEFDRETAERLIPKVCL